MGRDHDTLRDWSRRTAHNDPTTAEVVAGDRLVRLLTVDESARQIIIMIAYTVSQKNRQLATANHQDAEHRSGDHNPHNGGRAFAVAGPSTWDSRRKRLRDPSSSSAVFARLLKTFLSSEY